MDSEMRRVMTTKSNKKKRKKTTKDKKRTKKNEQSIGQKRKRNSNDSKRRKNSARQSFRFLDDPKFPSTKNTNQNYKIENHLFFGDLRSDVPNEAPIVGEPMKYFSRPSFKTQKSDKNDVSFFHHSDKTIDTVFQNKNLNTEKKIFHNSFLYPLYPLQFNQVQVFGNKEQVLIQDEVVPLITNPTKGNEYGSEYVELFFKIKENTEIFKELNRGNYSSIEIRFGKEKANILFFKRIEQYKNEKFKKFDFKNWEYALNNSNFFCLLQTPSSKTGTIDISVNFIIESGLKKRTFLRNGYFYQPYDSYAQEQLMS